MRWLLFLSRLAFICGLCFVLSLLLPAGWVEGQDVAGTIIIIGFVIGMLVVPITLLCYLFALFFKKNWLSRVPLWLVISNIFFLIALLVYIITINAKQNYPA